jgi:hypothetical protein
MHSANLGRNRGSISGSVSCGDASKERFNSTGGTPAANGPGIRQPAHGRNSTLPLFVVWKCCGAAARHCLTISSQCDHAFIERGDIEEKQPTASDQPARALTDKDVGLRPAAGIVPNLGSRAIPFFVESGRCE